MLVITLSHVIYRFYLPPKAAVKIIEHKQKYKLQVENIQDQCCDLETKVS